MMSRSAPLVLAVLLSAAGWPLPVGAQGASTPAKSSSPADPWPRVIDLANGQVLVYQPQINAWNGNQLSFRAALAIKPEGATQESYGVVMATARTQVDKVARTVVLENMAISKVDFPTLPDRGAAYTSELQVDNTPPQVIVSQTPAILVPVDGAPVMRATSDARYRRVVNTRALILQDGSARYFVHVYD